MAWPTPSPVAAVWLWIDAGAADEPAARAGAAHFLEHMLFKGTACRAVGAASLEIERCGGDLNAFTSWDHTVLHATVRAGRWEQAADVLADLARGPLFDPDEFAREREVILDEIRAYADDVGSVVHDALRARLWPRHPYGRPVLGTPDTVGAMPLDAVRGFWETHWTADRAVFAVAGPVEPDRAREEADRLLGTWAAGRRPRAALPAPPEVRPAAIRVGRAFA